MSPFLRNERLVIPGERIVSTGLRFARFGVRTVLPTMVLWNDDLTHAKVWVRGLEHADEAR